MEKLWTTAEVAAFLGIAEADVEELVKRGTLTGYQLGGRFLRFRPDQVEALKATFDPAALQPFQAARRPRRWLNDLRDFFYFYDFYLVSATLLAVMVIYLLAAGG